MANDKDSVCVWSQAKPTLEVYSVIKPQILPGLLNHYGERNKVIRFNEFKKSIARDKRVLLIENTGYKVDHYIITPLAVKFMDFNDAIVKGGHVDLGSGSVKRLIQNDLSFIVRSLSDSLSKTSSYRG